MDEQTDLVIGIQMVMVCLMGSNIVTKKFSTPQMLQIPLQIPMAMDCRTSKNTKLHTLGVHRNSLTLQTMILMMTSCPMDGKPTTG